MANKKPKIRSNKRDADKVIVQLKEALVLAAFILPERGFKPGPELLAEWRRLLET